MNNDANQAYAPHFMVSSFKRLISIWSLCKIPWPVWPIVSLCAFVILIILWRPLAVKHLVLESWYGTYLTSLFLILLPQVLWRATFFLASLHSSTFLKALPYTEWFVNRSLHIIQWNSVLGFPPSFELDGLEPSDGKRACLIVRSSVMMVIRELLSSTLLFQLHDSCVNLVSTYLW